MSATHTRPRPAPAPDVDAYLAALPADVRSLVDDLRRTIQATAPEAAEVISYQIPTFKLRRPLVAYAAFKDHCSLFVMSKAIMANLKDELRAFDIADTKTTIRFTADNPLPAALITRIVRARIAEQESAERERNRGRTGKK